MLACLAAASVVDILSAFSFAFAVASRVRARVACSFWDFGSSLCGRKEGRLRVRAGM